MIKALRWIWWGVGVLVAIQYGYWAVMFLLTVLGLAHQPPLTNFWAFLACGFAAISTLQMRAEEAEKYTS